MTSPIRRIGGTLTDTKRIFEINSFKEAFDVNSFKEVMQSENEGTIYQTMPNPFYCTTPRAVTIGSQKFSFFTCKQAHLQFLLNSINEPNHPLTKQVWEIAEEFYTSKNKTFIIEAFKDTSSSPFILEVTFYGLCGLFNIPVHFFSGSAGLDVSIYTSENKILESLYTAHENNGQCYLLEEIESANILKLFHQGCLNKERFNLSCVNPELFNFPVLNLSFKNLRSNIPVIEFLMKMTTLYDLNNPLITRLWYLAEKNFPLDQIFYFEGQLASGESLKFQMNFDGVAALFNISRNSDFTVDFFSSNKRKVISLKGKSQINGGKALVSFNRDEIYERCLIDLTKTYLSNPFINFTKETFDFDYFHRLCNILNIPKDMRLFKAFTSVIVLGPQVPLKQMYFSPMCDDFFKILNIISPNLNRNTEYRFENLDNLTLLILMAFCAGKRFVEDLIYLLSKASINVPLTNRVSIHLKDTTSSIRTLSFPLIQIFEAYLTLFPETEKLGFWTSSIGESRKMELFKQLITIELETKKKHLGLLDFSPVQKIFPPSFPALLPLTLLDEIEYEHIHFLLGSQANKAFFIIAQELYAQRNEDPVFTIKGTTDGLEGFFILKFTFYGLCGLQNAFFYSGVESSSENYLSLVYVHEGTDYPLFNAKAYHDRNKWRLLIDSSYIGNLEHISLSLRRSLISILFSNDNIVDHSQKIDQDTHLINSIVRNCMQLDQAFSRMSKIYFTPFLNLIELRNQVLTSSNSALPESNVFNNYTGLKDVTYYIFSRTSLDKKLLFYAFIYFLRDRIEYLLDIKFLLKTYPEHRRLLESSINLNVSSKHSWHPFPPLSVPIKDLIQFLIKESVLQKYFFSFLDDEDSSTRIEKSEETTPISPHLPHGLLSCYKATWNAISKHWKQANLYSKLSNLLSQERGRVRFAISCDEIEELFGPCLQLINEQKTLQKKENFIVAVKDFFRFFQFYIPEMKENKSDLELLFPSSESLKNIPQEALLSEENVNECRHSLLKLKVTEWEIYLNNMQKLQDRSEAMFQVIPCYLVAPDNAKIHLALLSAHFFNHELIGFGEDVRDTAMENLHSLEIIPEDDSITPEEFIRLKDSVKLENHLPTFLIVDRIKGRRKGEVEEFPEEEEPEAFVERHKYSKREFPKEEISDKKIDKSSSKQTHAIHLPKGKKRLNGARDPEEYQSLSPEEEEPPEKKSKKNSSPGGDFPNITNPDAPKTTEIIHDNFWFKISKIAGNKIYERALAASIRQSKLVPLQYPDFSIKELVPTNFSIWDRRLKPYQVQTVLDSLQAAQEGVSKILCLDMGLGKTPISGEYLIHQIASSGTKPHLVVSPASLLSSTQEKLATSLSEAAVTAWQILVKSPQMTQGYLIKLLNQFSQSSEKGFINLLRVYAHLQDSSDFSTRANFTLRGMLPKIKQILWEHLNKYKHNANFKNECEKIIPEIFSDDSLFERTSQKDLYLFVLKIGQILDISPDRQPLKDLKTYSKEEVDVLRQLSLDPEKQNIFIINENFSWKQVVALYRQSPAPIVILSTIGMIKNNFEIIKTFPIYSMIVDEAHMAQNEITQPYEMLDQLKEHLTQQNSDGQSHILFATGTPIANKIKELWNLLVLSNKKELFTDATFGVLSKLFMETKKTIHDRRKITDEDLVFEVQKCFAHYFVFRRMLTPFISRLRQTDSQVVEQWERRIPTARDIDLQMVISAQALKVIEDAAMARNAIALKSVFSKVLLHPSLVNTPLETNFYPFLDVLRKASPVDKREQFIEESPYLKNILKSEEFRQLIDSKSKFVIVSDTLAVLKAFKRASRRCFDQQIIVREYTGSMNQKNRHEVIDEFRKASNDRAFLLLLMIESGGVGLDLPEGTAMFHLNSNWNNAIEDQARARLLRVGYEGEKTFYHLAFPDTYAHEHPRSIQRKKALWESFMLDPEPPTLMQSLRLMCGLIEAECYHEYLNNSKSKQVASAKIEPVSESLQMVLETSTEEELTKLVAALTPQKPIEMEVITPHTIKEEDVFTVPLDLSTSLEQAHAMGAYLMTSPDSFAKEFKYIMSDFCQRPELRTAIREKQTAKVGPALSAIERLKKKATSTSGTEVQLFTFEDHQYVEIGPYHSSGVLVRLRKRVDDKKQSSYELIIFKNELQILKKEGVVCLPTPLNREKASILGHFLQKNKENEEIQKQLQIIKSLVLKMSPAIREQIRRGEINRDTQLYHEMLEDLFNKAYQTKETSSSEVYLFISNYYGLIEGNGPTRLRKVIAPNGSQHYDIIFPS